MKTVLRSVVALLLGALSLLPVSALQAEAQETVELPVLMYHQILPDPKYWGDYVISPETLEGDLDYLQARGYETVTLQQLLDYADGTGTLPEKPVLITFDDGQENVAAYGLPILERHQMSAVLAIVGRYADQYTESEDHNLNYACLSWPALAELNQNPCMELQNHTYNLHAMDKRKGCCICSGESAENYRQLLTDDLLTNEARFLQYIGSKPVAFAYPFGQTCAEAAEVLQELGYSITFTCEGRVNRLTPGDHTCLLNLGRYNRPHGLARETYFAQMGID